MTIEQTVEIPADHRLHLDFSLPESAGGTARVVVHFPAREDQSPGKTDCSTEWKKTLAALKRAQGAWKKNPWENYMEDIQAMRKEWDHRDFWNSDPAKQHRD
jgi:hypothetical protein